MSIFDKWDKSIDTEGLAKDAKEAAENGGSGEYPEVPTGKYEVKVEKMELKESSKGNPMFSAWFRIISGRCENNLLFMNQVITQGFQIGIVNDLIRSMDVVEDVEFRNYVQYNDLIMDVFEQIDGKLEFLLEYKKTKKDFPVYTIKEVYEV